MKVSNEELLSEIQNAIDSVKGYGSVEIYIQDSKITQITTKSIKKTDHETHRPCPVIDPRKNCPLLKS